jgi:cytoskeletal protein CcmA (bactofilin family)
VAKKSLFNSGESDGYLGEGTTLSGDLVFQASMQIGGRFKGSVRSEAQLSIMETADVEADIDVGILLVYGKVVGKIRATDRVEIHPGGKVIGDIRSPNLVTRTGAIFRGNCFIGEEENLDARPLHAERAFFKGAS